MAGLLSGLEQFGLTGLENVDLYDKAKKEEEKIKEERKNPEQIEQELLFEKSHTCPICDGEFKVKTVKIGKAKLVGTDMDLRPRYESIDMVKYDVIVCPNCGYAALSRFFKYVTGGQAKLIKENISKTFKPMNDTSPIYTYEEALNRYKLALANAVVKRAKPSEKAYICLKAAWLLRGMNENLDEQAADYKTKKAECEAAENDFLKSALDGFLNARQSETYPMCGMDESTVDYLIAITAFRFEKYDISSKLIAGILVSNTATPRMKEKAREVKEMLVKKIKQTKS